MFLKLPINLLQYIILFSYQSEMLNASLLLLLEPLKIRVLYVVNILRSLFD